MKNDKNPLLRGLFIGFMKVHILYHTTKESSYGLWLMEELGEHGFRLSAGTLYPMLHTLEEEGLLRMEKRVIDGKIRKYYKSTTKGKNLLRRVRIQLNELMDELNE